ncbi:MAG: filamentous hemagglutinin N-terminal domain-containing protein [Phycisphaeraceae bacterium]
MLARSSKRAESMLWNWAIAIVMGCWGALSVTTPAVAAPQGETVIRGNVNFSQQGNTTVITAGHNSIIQYQSFNIGAAERVQFVQPGVNARVLNRISGVMPTLIEGQLLANGQVYLVNPSGITFGPNSVINVGGLYAAAGNLSDADFLANVDHFTNLTGSVMNYGVINAQSVALVGQHVANHGSITASSYITLAVGNDVLVSESGSHVYLRLEGQAPTALAADQVALTNTGSLAAPKVSLVATDLVGAAIHQKGQIKANDIQVAGGAGAVKVSGSLDASNASGKGGRIEVSGNTVHVTGATIDASGSAGGGDVRIGGDVMGKGSIPNSTATTVSADSSIRADALDTGNGGSIVVWSDGVTYIAGSLSARGGAQGGNGGFIETSGKLLVALTVPDLAATSGLGGTWLLDPEDVEINAVDSNITQGGAGDPGPITFSPTLDDTVTIIDVANINAALDGGSNVVIVTASGGATTNGTITVNAPILKSADGGNADGSSLTFIADEGIVVNSSITSTTGTLNIDFQATLNVDINAAIDTNGGTFSSSGVGFDNTGGTISASDITLTHTGFATIGAKLTGTGAIAITGGTGVAINAAIDPVTVVAQSNNDVDIAANITASTSITIHAGMDGTGAVQFTAGGVTLSSEIISLPAGDGTGGGGALSFIDVNTNAPTFQNAAGTGAPDTWNYREDVGIADFELPLAAQFTGGVFPAIYNLQSDDGGVAINSGATSKIVGSALTITTGSGNNSILITGSGAQAAGSIMIDAGGGNDTFTLADGGGNPVPVGGLSFDGGTGTDTVIATDTANTWTINAADGGTVAGAHPFTFSNTENLTGGSNTDDFILNGGTLSGAINGGAGTNSLTGDSLPNTFTITGPNSGTATGLGMGFSNLENLIGNANTDEFAFTGPGSLDGTVDGLGSPDVLNFLNSNSSSVVVLTALGGTDGFNGTEPLIGGGFSNIDAIAGSNAANDSLQGINAMAVWIIDGLNTYTSTNVLAFGGFESLIGGNDVDTFNIDFTINPIPAGGLTINGGAGADLITLVNGAATNVTHNLNSPSTGNINRDGSIITYSNMEAITDDLPTTNRIFIFNGGGNDVITIDTDGARGRIQSVASSVPVSFAAPTTGLTVRTLGGNDAITINMLPGTFDALTLNTISNNSLTATANTNIGLDFTFGASGAGFEIFTGNAITADALAIRGTGGDDLINLTGPVVATAGNVSVDQVLNTIAGSVTATGDIFLRHGAGLDQTILGLDPTNLPLGRLTLNGPLTGANIFLGPDAGVSGIPSTATIIAPGSLTINASASFVMRPNSKLAVQAGDFNVTSPVTVLTEAFVNGNILVTSANITITSRGPSRVFDAFSQPFLDKGADFFALNINFTSPPTVAGGNRVFFVLPSGGVTSPALANVPNLSITTSSVSPQFVGLSGQVSGLALDFFDPALATRQNLSESLATALPEQLPDIAQSTGIGQDAREKLRSMDIPAEFLSAEELASMVRAGRRGYDDVGVARSQNIIGLGKRVSANRLRSDAVLSAIDTYDDLLGTDAKRAKVKSDLESAVKAYLVGKPVFNAADFRQSLPADSPARGHMDKLHALFASLAGTNLAPSELAGAKAKIVADIAPPGITVEQFLAAVAAKGN